MEKKPWYKSKIALLGLVIAFVGITDLSLHWLSGQGVSEAQIAVVQTAAPDAVQQIKDAVNANNWFGAISAIGGFVTTIWRIWFTNTKIE